ncbi:outer membrane autotransporter protein [Ereboglobus sp. PH5-5]|uniref:autotransporter outer membrane beta-barrel domain-containing protein n=1 Tax=Ereboglobus sp. PH5-5 TaxID=2940529 RepID=UPI002405A7B9|nr:autotransporter outer membrane beta-barrel domain-containing protein [Ereboglobus sp. PH5-5]MDF9832027.1 outer membrane autotransporter protein [Ereboglobus sp. PH5-5]
MKTHIRHSLDSLAGFSPAFILSLIFMAGIANGQTPTANVSGITSSTNYLVAGDPNFSPAFSATGQGAILTINGATIGTDASRATGAGGHASLISLGGNNGVVLPNDQDYGDLTLNLEGSILLYGRGSAIVEGIYIKTKSVDSTNTVNFNASNSVVDVTTSAVGSGNSNYTNTILAENQASSGGGTIVNITGDNNSFKTNYTGATVREMGTGANIYASGRKQAVINITGDNTTVESRGLAATGLSASSSTTAIINITGSNTQIRTDSVGIYANGGARASVNITGPGSSITTTAANAHGISTSSSAGSIRIDTTANITTAGTASDAIRAIATGSGAIDIGDAVTPITGTLTTTGHGAHGIEAVNSGTGNINIHSAAEITTGGNSSHGIYASASAPVTSSAININNTGAITTSGTGAMGIHASGSGSGKITINNTGDLVTTSTATVGGTYSHAIHAYVTATGASDGIEINHANGSITTAAYDATGIRAESTATSGDITVTVTDANITANGVNGDGILVQTKGLNGTDTDINITTNGGSINILETPSQTGNGSANYGIAALHITGTGALADATGDINIDNNGTDISTGTGATGVANAASAIYAHQQTAAGAAFTAQGDIRITSTGDLSTLGGNSHGIHALISGTAATGNISIGVNDSGAAAPVSGKIATAGAASHGIYASNAGSGAITINNAADITTGGAGSYGIHAVIANPASDGDIIINNSGNISATQNSPTRAIATLHAGSGNTYIASTGNFDPGSTTQLAHLIHATHAASSSGGIFIGYNADGSEAPITGTFASQGGGFGILAQHLGANATINIKVGDDASFTNTIATKNNGEGVIHAIYKPDASIADADNKADINLDIGKARLDLKNGSPSTAYSDGVVSVMNRGLYGTITVASAAEINSHNAAGYRIQAGAANSNVNIRLGTDTAPITGSITTTGTSSPGYHVYSGEVRAGGNIEIHNAATIDATGNRAYGIFIDQRVRDDLTDSLNLVRNTGDITTRTEGGAEDGGGGIRVSMGTLVTGGDASQIKIINDGKIDTDRAGIYAASHKGAASVTRAGEIDITNNGVIEAATYGIYARHYNTLGDLTIRNTGSITFANAIAPSSTTAPSGIHAEAIDGLMKIDNAGDISINSVSEPNAHGINAVKTGTTGDIYINNAADIETTGNASHGIHAQAAGDSNISINNTGDITTNGNEAHGLHATGTGDISITNSGAIITTGTFSHGIYVVGKSGITIDNNAGITTGAKSAHGILVNANSGNGDVSVTHATGKITIEDGSDDTGAGSWLNGAGVAVYISKSGTGNVNLVIDGDIETHAQNRGAGAYIHAMNNIGDLSITGSGNILAAADIPESTGTNVYSYGLAATINGSAVRNDGNVTITYSSGTIETRGNSAYALYAGVTSGTTPGGANSAAAIINTGRLITAGGSSSAIYARTENTEGAAIVVNSGNINTSGTSSHGIHAYSGSVSANARNNAENNSVYLAALTATPAPGSTSTIATTGDYSHGIYAVGSGARVVSAAETTNVSTTGSTSYGIHAANGAILSFKNGSITTTGDLSFGAAASGAGTLFTSTLALDNFNITTAGNMAHAAFANYDAFVSITGGTLTTTSANASTAVIKASGYDNTPGADRGGKLVAQNTTLIAKNNAVAVTVDNAGTIETTNATITSETGAILFGTDNQPVGAPLGSSVTIKTGAITAAAELVRAVNTTGTLTLDGVTSVANGTNAISFHASATNTNALRVILDNATSVTGDIIGGRQGETTPDDTLWSYTAATGSNTLNLDLLNGSQFHVRRATSGDYTYNHRTTTDATSVLKISLADGSGTNLIALGTNAAADMVNDFRGTLALGNGRFILGGAANSQGATNMSALANATLRLDALNRTAVEGAGAIAGLSFNGGTLAVRTSGSTGVNFVEDLLTVSGTLDASGGGTVEVALSGTVHNIIPATPPSAPALLDQDNYIETGTAGMMQNQLVAATGTVRNIGTQLSINFIPSSTSSGTITGAVSSTSALVQSGTHVADLTYDYYGAVTGSGIYLNYGLAQIDALAGQTVQISTDGATDNTLGAILSGSGNYTFTATDGMNIRVGNGLSDYTGATTIATGTVTAITDNALGKTSRLTLDPGSVLNLDGHEQTVHGQVVAAENSAINTGGGVLNVTATTTGSVRTGMGIYAGNAKINADGGSLNVDILTGGDAAHAVYSAAGSSITITSGTLRTTGAGASALTSTGSGVINASRVDISLTGSKSYGAYASNGGVINLADSAIATSGFYGLGVVADGGGAVVTATNVSIATTGASAHGVYLGNPGDSTVSLVNTAITTTGPNAHGVDITPHTSGTVGARTVTIDGGSMHTAGDIINVGYIEVPKGSSASNANLENQAVVTIKNIGSAASLVAETGNILNVQTARTGTDGSVTNVPTTVTLNVENSSLSGNIITDNAIADVSVLLKNATALTGKIDIANVDIDATSSWTITASSDVNNLTLATGAKIFFGAPAADNTVFKTLRVHGNLAGGANTITMSANLALLRGDLLRIDGNTTGSYTLDLSNHGGNPTKAGQRLMIVQAANEADFSLTGPQYRDAGLYRYYWVKGETDPANWYLANPTGTGDEPSPYSDAGQTIVNSASLLGLSWHYGMDSLHKRMGDVRAENLAANAPLTGNVWMRGYTYRLNALSPMRSSRFSQDTYGITAGADKALRNNSANATWLFGAFIDMGGTDRDFRNADDGSSTNVGLGLYATWLGDAGWYADIVLRADRYKHDFESRPYGGATVSGDYTSKAQGVSVEFGRMLKRADGWWLEPSVQISQGWLNGDTYETESSDPGNRMTVRVSDSDTLQYRGQLRFGRQLLSSRWHPYGKIGAARVDANGGEITALDTKVGPTYRGWRMEAGLGAAYRIDDGSQVYLDYEYAKAPAYERPWSLSLGYRRMW